MKRQIGHDLAREPAEADVLHNDRIDPGATDAAELLRSGFEFVGEYECVECDVCLYAVAVAKLDDARQFLVREIVRTHPRVEFEKSEIHGIRSVGDGGTQTVPASGGREQFGRFVHGSGSYHRSVISKVSRNRAEFIFFREAERLPTSTTNSLSHWGADDPRGTGSRPVDRPV